MRTYQNDRTYFSKESVKLGKNYLNIFRFFDIKPLVSPTFFKQLHEHFQLKGYNVAKGIRPTQPEGSTVYPNFRTLKVNKFLLLYLLSNL